MSFLRHGQIYQPMSCAKRMEANPSSGSASTPIGSMSLQLVIPRWVALQQSPPPLHQPASFSRKPAETVNRHQQKVGEFSSSTMRNFQSVLTLWSASITDISEVSRFSCMKFLGVFWGLRLRRIVRELALSFSAMWPSAHVDGVGILIASFRSSITQPTYPLFTLRLAPHGTRRKTRGRVVR